MHVISEKRYVLKVLIAAVPMMNHADGRELSVVARRLLLIDFLSEQQILILILNLAIRYRRVRKTERRVGKGFVNSDLNSVWTIVGINADYSAWRSERSHRTPSLANVSIWHIPVY
jgi:hypothetical protein